MLVSPSSSLWRRARSSIRDDRSIPAPTRTTLAGRRSASTFPSRTDIENLVGFADVHLGLEPRPDPSIGGVIALGVFAPVVALAGAGDLEHEILDHEWYAGEGSVLGGHRVHSGHHRVERRIELVEASTRCLVLVSFVFMVAALSWSVLNPRVARSEVADARTELAPSG